MKYSIGYIVQLSCGYAAIKSCPSLLTYKGNCFTIKRFSPDLLWHDCPKDCCPSTNLNDPVLFGIENGRILEMHYLSSLPFRMAGELTKSGIELYVPYIIRHPLDDGKRELFYDASEQCKWNYLMSSVYIDGHDAFPKEDYWQRHIGNNTYTFPESTFFPRLSVARFVLKKICSDLASKANEVRRKKVLTREGLSEKKDEFNAYLDSIKIDKITDGLKVRIDAHYHHKAGDDDWYTADKIVELDNPIAQIDEYLTTLIGIGEHDLYSTHSIGVPYYAEDSRDYSDIEIEKERERIRESYSRIDHMESLVLSYLRQLYEESYDLLFELPSWIERLQNVSEALFTDYKLITIKGHTKVCKTDLKWYVNNHLLYKCKEIDDGEFKKITRHIEDMTQCDFESFRKRNITSMGYWYLGSLDSIISGL